jgi:hypothetical protein
MFPYINRFQTPILQTFLLKIQVLYLYNIQTNLHKYILLTALARLHSRNEASHRNNVAQNTFNTKQLVKKNSAIFRKTRTVQNEVSVEH